jgi:hypothetical protein
MIRIIALALAGGLLSAGMADAATCLSSAAEVRKFQPKAWPKWTYGPNRQRCWYAGEKPVFAKAPPEPTPPTQTPETQPTSPAAPATDGKNSQSIGHPWVLEYRWAIGDAP